ncbi:His Kinase A (phospho-acceptor) domain-containing protein [Arthrobacter sp. ok909]|uniref:sensor histidine kinase n=1 Tax=Arthrobacter sp. ok909 TaxID=1761746 RepID=UPI00087E03E3|nr:HAMP domain-containing sensor histidine kinase [Arthrobacter sp. ok909]SDP39903.1 His Kinase A (phospho-acceptor) domain-containing protein [Arthrobacter sp. ok909]
MSNGGGAGETPDHSTLRKASLKVALRISAACAVMVLGLLAATALYLVNQLAHPEVPRSASAGTAYAYLDSRDVLEAMLIAGVAGIVLAGIVGWLSARSAIRPLGDALARQRRFVQDASHELRTPLTILDTRIQLAQRNTEPGSKQAQDLARIREDAATLTGIVNELLLAATTDAPDRSAAPADLAGTASGVAEGLRLVAEQRDVRLDFSADARPLARIDANALRRAVLALADNALSHTPPGGRVTITTAIEQNRAVITVADTGTGITGVDQARIFDRFVRTASTGGTQGQRSFGIGLALVREIAVAAGGAVEVASTGSAGTVMKMTLPLAAVGNP